MVSCTIVYLFRRQFSIIYAKLNKNGYAVINKNGKLGYIDKNGKVVIEPQYDYALYFSDGLAPVGKCNTFHSDCKFGYINPKGELVIGFNFDGAREFREGLAEVTINGKHGYIDTSGQFVSTFMFVGYSTELQNGTADVQMNKKWGRADKNGKFIIEPQFDELHGFFAKLNGKWGVIDESGNFIIEPIYDNIRMYTENWYGIEINYKQGIIDKDGKKILDPIYDGLGECKDGLCRVAMKREDAYGPYYVKEGVINTKGEFVADLGFERVEILDNGIIRVHIWTTSWQDDKIGYMDRNGNYIWKPTK